MFLVLWYIIYILLMYLFFFFKQKTAYEMRISDWSSDVCSSDLADRGRCPAGRSGLRQSTFADDADRICGSHGQNWRLGAHPADYGGSWCFRSGDRKSVV